MVLSMLEIIAHKRDGAVLTPEEIQFVVTNYTQGKIPDYQVSAWLMSVYLQGMNFQEASELAMAMRDSGEQLHWPAKFLPIIDKHSTGGVGDKVSLILAPILAACNLYDPMIAGRGLGHTGGTLDKLESIPGFDVALDDAALQAALQQAKVVITGATTELAPADRLLYALRDTTGTVASIPLIASSIMSKKLAAGISGLVMDVKCGSGAFMKTQPEARELAQTLVAIGKAAGIKMAALITNMEQPLGLAIGNSLEVQEAIACLTQQGPEDITELTLTLAAQMLVMGDKAGDLSQGHQLAQGTLRDGTALACFKQMVAAQGGDVAYIDDPSRLPKAPQQITITAPKTGVIGAIATEQIGMAVVHLGGGRLVKEAAIDPAVGIVLRHKIGDAVVAGEPLAVVHANQVSPELLQDIQACFKIQKNSANLGPLVLDTIL
ncbi:pyrimidine-nucleoside phosphorylase [Agrilactobacillus composti DSM 18527 = JCM 14202]|nr:thymidine phosphorylase [Agrilactobacillus composti]GAF38756.1 pyrimidine-nucleoside phosphorylase [Agrilactobacillus composti DSM 18527 = JCM 14202]